MRDGLALGSRQLAHLGIGRRIGSEGLELGELFLGALQLVDMGDKPGELRMLLGQPHEGLAVEVLRARERRLDLVVAGDQLVELVRGDHGWGRANGGKE